MTQQTNLFFNSVLSVYGQEKGYIICVVSALILGLFTALCYSFKTKHSKGFVLTLSLLPVMVQTVIMLVNGNIGAGVAVAGAFSLVRFRSAPGSAKEIASVFLAMTVGLACGMGYVGIALVVAVVVSLIYIIVGLFFSDTKSAKRELRITIPENLDYTEIFDDVFSLYTTEHIQTKVKTANMGSLFKVTYQVKLKDISKEKEFLDDLRIRNGNLEIVCSRTDDSGEGLL